MADAIAATKALRSDPIMAKILDKPRVKAAIMDVQSDARALSRYLDDPEVMQVLSRLLDIGVSPEQSRQFAEFGTTPTEVATSVYSNPELVDLLQLSVVKEALAAGGRGDVEALEALATKHPDVRRALAILEAAVGQVGGGAR